MIAKDNLAKAIACQVNVFCVHRNRDPYDHEKCTWCGHRSNRESWDNWEF